MSARKPRRSRTGPGQYSIEEQRERMIQHRHELQLFAGCGRTLEDSLWQCLPSSGAGHGKAGVHGAGAPRSPLTLVQAYGICTADGTWLNSIQEEGDQVKIASQASKSGNYAYVFQLHLEAPPNILATNMASAITDSYTSMAVTHIDDNHVPIPRRRADNFEFVFLTIQVCVRLECEEKVPVDLFKPGTIVATKDVGIDNPLTVSTRVINRTVVGDMDECVLDCQATNFAFMIPPTQSSTLYTDKVTCEWILRFEFYYATVAAAYNSTPGQPIQNEEVIRWHQPLHVFVPPLSCKNEKPGKTVYAVAP